MSTVNESERTLEELVADLFNNDSIMDSLWENTYFGKMEKIVDKIIKDKEKAAPGFCADLFQNVYFAFANLIRAAANYEESFGYADYNTVAMQYCEIFNSKFENENHELDECYAKYLDKVIPDYAEYRKNKLVINYVIEAVTDRRILETGISDVEYYTMIKDILEKCNMGLWDIIDYEVNLDGNDNAFNTYNNIMRWQYYINETLSPNVGMLVMCYS